MRTLSPCFTLLFVTCTVQACGSGPGSKPTATPEQTVTRQIVTNETSGTEAELRTCADKFLLARDYRAAIVPLEALRSASPNAQIFLDLGMAYEAIAEREKALQIYSQGFRNYRSADASKGLLLRFENLAAYMERWDDVMIAAQELESRYADDAVATMTVLGARGLALAEKGDDVAAMKHIQNGLDRVDQEHYGSSGRLPVAAAQLRFALGEVRRMRSEKIQFAEVPTEQFLMKFEARCSLLLDAQSAFTDAIRSEDPRWAAMSGVRVGEMYRVLHRDLMAIPPTKQSKTKDQQALFYSMMHVRYRVLLEKGLDMMDRTIALGDKLGESSAWTERARATKQEIEQAIADEKNTIAKLPYTEDEVKRALEILRKKVEKSA